MALLLAALLLTPVAPALPARAVLVIGEGLKEPFGVDFDAAGNMYVVEMGGNRVSVLDKSGALRVLAGTGEKGLSGDGGPALKARFNGPHHLALGPDGALYVADTFNNCVRRIDLRTGVDHARRGHRREGLRRRRRAGRGGAVRRRSSRSRSAGSVLYICDLDNRRIRAVDLEDRGRHDRGRQRREGRARRTEETRVAEPLVDPRAMAVDSRGQPLHLRARRSRPPRGRPGRQDPHRRGHRRGRDSRATAGPARAARLNGPKHISVDADDDVLIADTENHVIRRYSPRDGRIRRVVGTGTKGSARPRRSRRSRASSTVRTGRGRARERERSTSPTARTTG